MLRDVKITGDQRLSGDVDFFAAAVGLLEGVRAPNWMRYSTGCSCDKPGTNDRKSANRLGEVQGEADGIVAAILKQQIRRVRRPDCRAFVDALTVCDQQMCTRGHSSDRDSIVV